MAAPDYTTAQTPAPPPPQAPPTGMTSSYVRLRGLPFTSSDQDVAGWFQQAPGGAIQVIRVIFTYNTTGRKSGEAVRA